MGQDIQSVMPHRLSIEKVQTLPEFLNSKNIMNNKSLLPSGVKGVEGAFEAGEVIWLNDKARAVTNFSSEELKALAGKHSTEIRKLLGPKRRDVVAIPEDIVFVDY